MSGGQVKNSMLVYLFLDKDKLFGNRTSKNFDVLARGTSEYFQIFLPLYLIVVPTLLELLLEAVVDGVYNTQIFIQCSCLIVPLHGFMKRHCEKLGCSFQTLEGRPPIGYYTTLFLLVTYTLTHMINHGLRALVRELWV